MLSSNLSPIVSEILLKVHIEKFIMVDEYDQTKEYEYAVYNLQTILETKYAGDQINLTCNGFSRKSWQLKTVDIDIKISDDLENAIVYLMSVSDIDYLYINWDGYGFKNFYPIDVFAQIDKFLEMFDMAVLNYDGKQMSKISGLITSYCEVLADEYDDDDYLDLAIEYMDMIDFIKGIEIQEQLLMKLLSVKDVDYDSIFTLFNEFNRNVLALEEIYPGTPFIENLRESEPMIMELMLNYASDPEPLTLIKSVSEKLKLEEEVTMIYEDPDFSEVSEDDMKKHFSSVMDDGDVLDWMVYKKDLGDLEYIDWNTVLDYYKFKASK